MGWFRPARTVCDPSGVRWEIYVSRIAPPPWKQGASDRLGTPPGGARVSGLLMVVGFPFALLDFLWGSLLVPATGFLVALPGAVLRGRRSEAVRIEAIRFYPDSETRLWTTTRDQEASVLAEIASGLERGAIVHPTGAVYSGTQPF